MAKSPRISPPVLPFSERFYQLTQQVGARFGLPVADDQRLSAAVAALSHTYTRERAELLQGALGPDAPLARLGFFLARDAIKVFGPLEELRRSGRFEGKSTLRVLDLGAGLGSTTLGCARFMRHAHTSVTRLEVTALERDPMSLKLMRALVAGLGPLQDELAAIELTVRTADITRELLPGPFDLVLMGLSLNELFLEREPGEQGEARAQLLSQLSQRLTPSGALIVLEPALKESARALMRVRDALLAHAPHAHVFAPCVHRAPCPMLQSERDWCHESLDYALPPRLANIARRAGLRYEGLSYAALVLSPTPRHAQSEHLHRIVSDRLPSKGKLELYGCSAQGYQRLTRLERDASPVNRAFEELRRGDIAELTTPRVTKQTPVIKR